jgi:hypothetical protein
MGKRVKERSNKD